MSRVVLHDQVEVKLGIVIRKANALLLAQNKLNERIASAEGLKWVVDKVQGLLKLSGANDLEAPLLAKSVESADRALRKELSGLRSWLEAAPLGQSNPRGTFVIKTRKRMPPSKF